MYNLKDYHYNLPPELIAQVPAVRRDESRMMVVNRAGRSIDHKRIAELEECLERGALVVLNDTRVVPARLKGKKESGGRVEVLVLHPAMKNGPYRCLMRASKPPKPGVLLYFAEEVRARVCEPVINGHTRLDFLGDRPLLEILNDVGCVPLPPYIRRNGAPRDIDDARAYQTVFAAKPGAVAAPTAGLHFSRALLDKLHHKGVHLTNLTLHVGFGTFKAVREKDIRRHRMHEEFFEIPIETARAVNRAKKEGRRVLAVGTTTVRALEFAACCGRVRSGTGWCDLFIYPGYRFQIIDGLLTNFHLPGSSLLMLVAAWTGHDLLQEAYAEAVRRQYRFYSYGNAMLIE